jgi:RNA polymerase sigma factor (sigma-70 family)
MLPLPATNEARDAAATALDVEAARRGDPAAYRRLVDAYRNTVCSISLAIVRDLDASEEVAQEVLVAAWRDLGKLRNPESFGPWLRQLTRNRARQHLRTHLRARRRLSVVGERLEEAADPTGLAPDLLARAEDQRRLRTAIDELPDDAREVVTLYYREGRSVAQVASLLDLGEDTVKKRLQRARERLRQALLDEAGEALVRTAPGAAFTAAVCGALALGAPSTAAAGGALVGAAPKLGLPLLGSLLAALPGVAGVALWFARPLWDARPGPERREVGRLAALAALHPVLFALALRAVNLIPSPGPRMAALVCTWIAFVASALGTAYLPLLRGRYYQRRASEAAGDPRASARLRLERRLWIAGLAAGIVAGSATVVFVVARALG